MVIAQFDSFELRILELADAGAFGKLEPGDLSCSQGEWLFAQGRENDFVEKRLRQYADGQGFPAVILKDKVLIGTVSLIHFDESAKCAGLAYALGGAYRGKGIMTKACRLLMAYGFQELGLNTIQFTVDTANKPSLALAERLGFKRGAVVRNAYQSENGPRDVVPYALVRRDFEAIR
jgi:ribosomal-protein-serine acetyltransferase